MEQTYEISQGEQEVALLKEVDFFSKTLENSLKTLLKDTKRATKDAVDALVALMASEDPKIKLAAAKAILDMHVEVASRINDDNLRRLIAHTKEGSKKLLTDEDEEAKPLVDFTTIRKV